MAEQYAPTPLSADELDAMSPDERADALRARIVKDIEAIPARFREEIYDTARRLGQSTDPIG